MKTDFDALMEGFFVVLYFVSVLLLLPCVVVFGVLSENLAMWIMIGIHFLILIYFLGKEDDMTDET